LASNSFLEFELASDGVGIIIWGFNRSSFGYGLIIMRFEPASFIEPASFN